MRKSSQAPTGTSRGGRTRSEDARLRILGAAYELAIEVDYADLTIEAIAARAGAGKQTVYRWWPTKADVLLDAIAEKADLQVTVADHGSFAADLTAFLDDSAVLLARPGVARVLRVVMAESQRDPQFRHRFREKFLLRRRAAFATITSRAAARRDAPDGIDQGIVADLVFGFIWYRVLAGDPGPGADDIGTDDVAALVRVLAPGARTGTN